MIEINVKIKRIVWAGEDGTEIVKLCLLDEKFPVNAPDIDPTSFTGIGKFAFSKNEVVKLAGNFKVNKHGPYFNIENLKNGFSDKENDMIKFLSAGYVSCITPKIAKAIVSTYGTNITDVFSNTEKLMQIKGIGLKNAMKIMTSFNENIKFFKLYELTNGAMSINMIKKIAKFYGDKAYDILKENPYSLIYDFKGIGFKKADKFATDMGYSDISDERFLAGIVFTLKESSETSGHVYLPVDELKEAAKDLLFPMKDYLKIVFYKDILGTEVPDDDSEWQNTSISTFKEYVLKKIVETWNDFDDKKGDYMSNAYTKFYKLTGLEADTIDTLASKRKVFSDKLPDLIIEQAERGKIVIEDNCIYEANLYNTEVESAKNIVKIIKDDVLHNPHKFKEVTKEKIIESIIELEEEPVKLGLSDTPRKLGDEQVEAVIRSCTNPCSIITGGPGRGKTTIIKGVIKAFKKCGNNKFLLMAPTGRASQRMSESTGMQAQTIHRVLLSGATYEGYVIIVDEMSMVDINLFSKLTKLAINNVLILVGDVDQLPSIGPGRVLNELIKSDVVPCTRLIQCYRNEGSVINNINSINKGCELDKLEWDNKFKMIKVNDEDNEKIGTILCEERKKLLKIFNPKDVCIITCKRKSGNTSTNVINSFIQAHSNPIPEGITPAMYEYIYSDDGIIKKFRLHDRVIHLKNDYSMEVKKPVIVNGEITGYTDMLGCFNGETGEVTNIDPEMMQVTVTFDDGKIAVYDNETLENLELAYAITTHKAQGSEYKAVLFVGTKEDFVMLDRTIIYTGISRTQVQTHIVGSPKYLNIGIKKVNKTIRYTKLGERIIALLSA